MIEFKELTLEDSTKIKEIDRSEKINSIFQFQNGKLEKIKTGHECPNWTNQEIGKLENRFKSEIEKGGKAFGAFHDRKLVGFGLLSNKFRGKNKDRLQIDLMYVSREFRRQGIGTKIMEELSKEAKLRGAKYLYISSTETESAYNFYKNNGSELTGELDEELFKLEPLDIHLVKKL
ncbi:MAG: N-acetyltransferase [Calditrichaeota bacterium]|nr:MAG: N-acetyltransferase [Calditrichota bacterium]